MASKFEQVELHEGSSKTVKTSEYAYSNTTFQSESSQQTYPAPLPPNNYDQARMDPNTVPTAPQYYAPPPAPMMPVMVQPGMVPTSQFPAPAQNPIHGFQHNVPQTLEYLATLDQVLVKQKVELLEAFTDFETKNRYHILDPQGRQIFYAKESTDCCTRQCCGSIRPFDMKLKDGNDQEIIHFQRPLACGSCCFPCCLQSLEVESPPGNVIGSVKQKWSIWIPKYNIKDETGKTVYYIEGPCCTCSCFGGDVDFKIYNEVDHGKEVGRISKKWSGLAKEYFTDADNFGISFPPGASGKMKATLLGACMLIDFMYFEQTDNNRNNNAFN